MTASPGLLTPGTSFGGYRIERLLGEGGMGAVYEATELQLGRGVALKVLRPELSDDVAFGERFRREQRVMASLNHPHVLPIYQAGVAEGRAYLAMRLVREGTLADLIAEGPLESERAADIVNQAAQALDAAHEAGMVHRDVKPQNILIAERDHVYLSDFGLVVHDSRPDNLTRTGQFVGTIDYVAPEQIQGSAVTALADVYALGCVLFEALTGSRPYPRDTPVAVLWSHVSEPPPRPTAVRPELPEAFDAVIEEAMAKDPDRRFATAGELGTAAVAASTGVPVLRPPPSPAPRLGAAAPAPSAWAVPMSEGPSSATVVGGTSVTAFPSLPAPASPMEPAPPAGRASRIRVPRLRRRFSRGGDTAAREPEAVSMPEPGESPTRRRIERIPAFGSAGLSFGLMPDFRYVHQPLADDSEGVPLLGNEDVVAALKRRIVHSAGGSFLITGFRGVGKTTVIARALSELQNGDAPVSVLSVTLNVARPKSVEQLLFEIIRRVFETLKDEDLLARMEPKVQRELLLAYARTSLSFNESRSNSSDRGAGLRLGLPAFLQGLTPQLELSRKSTDVLATQASFLAYTDADVEHDFLRIVSLVERERRDDRGNGAAPAWRGKLVVVIDELDKLTCDEKGRKCLDNLLSGLKNLLTARGVHFLFVAGPDLHDAALRDRRRGNSVYESVFGWQLYVPCLWSATDRLLDALLDVGPEHAARLAPLRDYLRFKSRGIPRLLLMELNSFVRWDEDGPWIEVAGPDRARVEFYAELEQVVGRYVHGEDTARPFAVAIDEDRWQLGAYYLADWILQSEGAAFTVDELIDGESDSALDPLFSLSPGKVESFLAHLVRNGILERSGGRDPEATFYSDVPAAQKVVYRLTPTTRAKLADFARVNEDERAALAGSDRAHQPWAESGLGGVVGDGRYVLVEELDRDGLGRVYRARDRYGDRDVAIKIFESDGTTGEGLMQGRFARKAAIARSLTHPHIVRTHDVFEEGAFLVLVMDLVEGTSLERLLERVRPSATESVGIAVALADALAYVWSRGIARLDLKPSRIFIRDLADPVILDIGLAKHIGAEDGEPVDALTMARAILGTPRYAAPEQLRGEDADIRSDLYALGLILYEMLRGRRARAGSFSAVLGQADGPVDTAQLDVSPALREVVARMVAPSMDDRFADPGEARSALAATPEGTGTPASGEGSRGGQPADTRQTSPEANPRRTAPTSPRGPAR